MNNLFTSSVTFKLCKRDDDGNLVDTEEVRIQNITIDGINYVNGYIRQAYLTAQKDAMKHWTKAERDEFMKLAMKNVLVLALGTKEGNDILFGTLDGILHWTWAYVRHHFKTIEEWDKVLRSDPIVYREIMNRFNEALLDLALLTGREITEDLPDEDEHPEALDTLVKHLVAGGRTVTEATSLTPEQGSEILNIKYPDSEKKEQAFQTDNPEEFKAMLAKQLTERSDERTDR